MALAVGLVVAIGLTAGAPRAAANPSGASPAVYVAGVGPNSGEVGTLTLAGIKGGGATSTILSGLGVTVGPVAVNATATTAVVGYTPTAQTFQPAPRVAVINVATGGVTGSVPVLATPIGFAMDPANPDLAWVLAETAADPAIEEINIGVTPPTVTTLTTTFDGPVTPTSIAISPNGATLFVGGEKDDTYVIDSIPIAHSTDITPVDGPGKALLEIVDLAVAPDGQHLFAVANSLEGGDGHAYSYSISATGALDPVPAWTQPLTSASPIQVPNALTVNPGGQTVYIAGNNDGSSGLQAFDANTGSPTGNATIPIAGGGTPTGISVSPDESRLIVLGNTITATGATGPSVLYPVSLPSLAVGPPTTLPFTDTTGPEDIAMTPDQAPVASFTASIAQAGAATTFNAGTSTVAYGSVTSFAWNFGDGNTSTTGSPTVSHTYAAAGTYTVSVTETDSAGTTNPPAVGGTSFAIDSAGQTAFRRADSSAQAVHAVSIPLTPPPATTTTTAATTTTTTTSGHHVSSTPPGKHVGGTPTLVLNPAVGPPGTVVTVTGTGFQPNAPVTISWSVSTGSVVVTANAHGDLPPSELFILIPDVLGPRFADASSNPQATAPFLVVSGSTEPGGDDAAIVYRSEGP